MSLAKSRETYRVESGSRLKLGGGSTNDKSLFEGTKEESLVVLEGLRADLKEEQTKLFAKGNKRLLVVIQAMDTGGKDGCVKSVFGTVDPQGVHVEAFKKPTEDELAHDFLWRIHAKVPRNGLITVFNRSHYEDIIAVKVKEIFPEHVWKQRYRHVVEFERMLAEEGTKVVKIFLNISKDEQKERLQARLDDPAKHWKFNPDDLLDRAKWSEFMNAYEHLLEKTSTDYAPWYVVPADRKWYRNLVVSQIIKDALLDMDLEYPEVDWDPASMIIKD